MTPVKVREPDGLGEPLVHQLLHGLPGVKVVTVHVGAVEALVSQREHRVLAVVRGEAAVRAESANLSCKVNPSYREQFSDWSTSSLLIGQMSTSRLLIGVTCAGHCLGPVDHKGVDVVQLEILQGLHDVRLDVLRPVIGVPELGLKLQFSYWSTLEPSD